MSKGIYSKPVSFALMAAVVILIGTLVTMFYPMLTAEMHPKLDDLMTPTPLELAGRDIYQREGCNNCHTQTVRPLKTEVLRYGDYSKAGEFAYDYPFLWGSKRTGPDLARVGGKYPDKWHYRHFEDPQAFFEKSSMPKYGWLKDNALDPATAESHMKALGFAYEAAQLEALKDQTELDALVAYTQYIGRAVKVANRREKDEAKAKAEAEAQAAAAAAAEAGAPVPEPVDEMAQQLQATNPDAGKPDAIAKGLHEYAEHCEECHAEAGEGDIGPALNDIPFLGIEKGVPDGYYFTIIQTGTEDGFAAKDVQIAEEMPGFGEQLQTDEIWALVAYIRSLQPQQ